MNVLNRLASMLALATIASLYGCASDTGAANGRSVRAIMASQIVAPQPRSAASASSDSAAAVAAYANYQQSYVTPVPASDTPAIGKK